MKRIKVLKSPLIMALVLILCIISSACTDTGNQIIGPKDSLVFEESIVITHQEASVYSDEIITTNQPIDCYKDDKENLYYFIPNTDSQCGYSKKYYYGFFEENPISIEEAISIADTYLNEKVENFRDYVVVLSEHSEADADSCWAGRRQRRSAADNRPAS